jgi:pyrroloquinoline quinone biosynthesis protein E
MNGARPSSGGVDRRAALHLSAANRSRRDLEEISHRRSTRTYTNLVTSAVLLRRRPASRRIGPIMQVSIQDVVPRAPTESGYQGGVAKKRDVARWTRNSAWD